jgi:membrane fusion protein, multidrug efflux system
MAEDVVELETRPVQPLPSEGTDLAPVRENDLQYNDEDKGPKDPRLEEADKPPASLPRWPFIPVGLVVAVLYIIFRPHPDVRTADAYVMVHYATIAPRISGASRHGSG